MPLSPKALTAPPRLAVRTALALRKALLRAADAVVPPNVAICEHVTAGVAGHVLSELARLGVPDLLETRPMSAVELAERTQTDASAMARTMRAAIALGVFEHHAHGRYANNRLSRALLTADTDSARAFAMYFGSRSTTDSWADFAETLRTGQSAFERVHGVNVWEWFDRHPDERETFAQAMMSLTLMDAPGIATTYPFGEIGILCDMGGGRGTLLSEILVHHPRLRGMLCDVPGVIESARALLTQRGVAARVELVPGSFFDSVPSGADAYLLKNILHDWDDARSTKILQNCRAAMSHGQRIVVVEAIVEDDTKNFGALLDLQMMVVGEGRERSRADFERLLRMSGFRLARTFDAPTPIAIIEGIAV